MKKILPGIVVLSNILLFIPYKKDPAGNIQKMLVDKFTNKNCPLFTLYCLLFTEL